MTKRPAANGALQVTTSTEVASSVPQATPDPVEGYLRRLVARCADVPLVGELTADDLSTPCGTASIARAALIWLLDGRPAAIREQLQRELRESDWLTVWRVRQMSYDLSAAEDWTAVAKWTPMAELKRLRTYDSGAAS